MLIAIDIGNTNVVVGAFSGDEILASWRVATVTNRTRDEYGVLFASLFDLAGIDRDALEGAIICSVVPAVQETICLAARHYWDLEPLIVSPELDTGVPVRYNPPEAVGPDRIANAVAIVHQYGTPAIVVDFGTATTFDAVSRDGAYVGGAIAPGIEIAAHALFSRTARLRPVPLEAPASAVGEDTEASLQSGILFGYAGLVDGLVHRFRRTLGADAPVIATGGLAGVVAPHAHTIQHVDPNLTLVGLRILYDRNATATELLRARQNQSLA